MGDEKSSVSVELVETKADGASTPDGTSSLSVPSLESKASKSGLLNLPKSDSKGTLTHSASKPELGKQKSKPPKSSKGDLDAQTKAFSAKNTIMAAAYAGDSDLFFKFINEQGWQAAQEVGPVGDCPFLVLFLIHSPKHLEIARRCVLEFQKKLIFSEYKQERPGEDGEMIQTPIYYGETALHLAVVNKNEELVDFLMGVQKELHEAGECLDLDLLKMPALGLFFAPPLEKGPCYYGEVPLGFAACTANISLCGKLLHTYGADLQFEDSHGNNLLHLLALHNLPEMFKYILQEEKASLKAKEPGYVPLAQRKNNEGITPLGLAASSGNKEVFGIIIDSSKVVVWTYGPIEMIKFPLEELDTLDLVKVDKMIKSEPIEDNGEDRVGTIEMLIREGHLELLMQKVLIDVLDNKWTRYAFRRYLLRCLKQSILILSVTFALILGYPDPAAYPFEDANSKTTTVFRVFFELIVVYMVSTKGFSEMNEMRNAGLRDYYGDVGVAFLENALASSYCFFIFCVVIVRIVGITLRARYLHDEGDNSPSVYGPYWADQQTGDPNLNNEFPSVTQHADVFFQSIAVMLIYFYALTLLLGFRLTGQFVIMIYKMLRNDVLRFCMVFFLFILGFATAFLALQSVPYPDPISGWEQIFANLYGLFQVITSGVDFEFADSVALDWHGFFVGVSTVLQVFFAVVMTIMLLNLLIAMMGDTYGIVKDATEMEYIQYKAQIIMSLENEMTAKDWKSIHPYWISDGGKPWLQVQIKNEQFLSGAPPAVIAAPVIPQQSAEEKFKGADADGDGSVSEYELSIFERDLRSKLELEFLQRIAGAQQQTQLQPQSSLYVNPSELRGGFARDGVYSVETSN